ncbi:GRF1-interacting factor [Trifolium repens]|nr:GRF1-interacting factor [Trifolium repens]
MLLLSERNCQLIRDIPEEIKTLVVHDRLIAECQAQLHKNLMYLAAIADAQPQTQMAPLPSMQHRFYMQHPQVAALAQQQGEGKSHIIETTVEAIF